MSQLNREEEKDAPRAIFDNSLPINSEEATAVVAEHNESFGKLIRTLQYKKVTAVAIEAGHIYADQVPNQEQRNGFAVAREICSRLSANGITPHRIVFIDDYNAERNGFCLKDYLQCAIDCEFSPEIAFWESDMVGHAEELLKELEKIGQVQNGDSQELFTVKHSIKLRHANGRLTCALLDAAFHLKRFRQFGCNITVLPARSEDGPEHGYRHQQRNMRRLLRLLRNDQPPLTTVFFDRERNPTIVPFQ